MESNQTNNADYTPTTGTGLDRLVETIVSDPGLNHRVEAEEIAAGARAADAMNQIIVEAIKATGLANDGTLNAADVRDLSGWVREHGAEHWAELHGDDEHGEETGFHLVQNDGASSRLFAANAVNQVADGIYHLGFEIGKGRFLNEDGNKNASVEQVSEWLGKLLEGDLEAGDLANGAVDPYAIDTTTGTGLDRLVDIITDDRGLNAKIATSEIYAGANAAADLNALIVESIRATGVANDGDLNMADVRELNGWVRAHALDDWIALHGDDECGEETGFHLVQNDGATSRLFSTNAVNNVADGIYHLGFEIEHNRFLNEDGNKNVSVETLQEWLGELLEDDLASGELANSAVDPYAIDTTTGTGLDRLVDIITDDSGLNARLSTGELYEGANAAADLNALIVESIRATGVADDGTLSKLDLYDVNDWLRGNALEDWTRLHGDDECGEETGFHLVQNDGATTRLFATNAVNNVADGLYHMGFEIDRGRFLNEDGDKNVSVEKAAYWLNDLLEEDLAAGTLANPDTVDVAALQAQAVYRLDGVTVDGAGDQVEVAHDASLALAEGTFSFSFTAEEPGGWDRDTLFSKDAKYNGDGGHVTAWVRNDEVQVRLQGTDSEVWLKSGRGTVEAGQEYDFAFSFGADGAHLYLDGVKVDAEYDYLVNLTGNAEDLAIGASTWARTDSNPDWRADYFHGQIDDFAVYDQALSNSEVWALSIV